MIEHAFTHFLFAYKSKSIKFSAISANESSDSWKYVSKTSFDQSSTRFHTPITTHSLSKSAYFLSVCGILILPCLSTSHSTAPEKKKRVNARASFLVNGNFFNFSSTSFHSSIGYINKHLSSPRVTTN